MPAKSQSQTPESLRDTTQDMPAAPQTYTVHERIAERWGIPTLAMAIGFFCIWRIAGWLGPKFDMAIDTSFEIVRSLDTRLEQQASQMRTQTEQLSNQTELMGRQTQLLDRIDTKIDLLLERRTKTGVP